MELVLNQELETLPEPVINRHFTNNGLLNTNYNHKEMPNIYLYLNIFY